MKDGLIAKINWIIFRRPIIKHLPQIGVIEPKTFYKKAYANYLAEVKRLPKYGKNDVLKLNLLHSVMLGAIYKMAEPKPDVTSFAKFYHDFLFEPVIVRKLFGKTDMLKSSNIKKELKQSKKSQKAEHPFTWQYSIIVHDKNRFTAIFTRCGICDYLRSINIPEVIPAMCALDFSFCEISNHWFLREQTLATGGKVCDCHYVRKSTASEDEKRKFFELQKEEALRGGIRLYE